MSDYAQIAAEIESLLLPEGRVDPAEVERSQRRRLQLALALESHRSGYEVVAVDKVADTAMLSKATLYSLFVSKKGLLAAAVKDFRQIATDAVGSSIEESAGWEEAILSGVRGLLGAVAAEPALARLTFVEAPPVLTAAPTAKGNEAEPVESADIALLGAAIDRASVAIPGRAPDAVEARPALSGLTRLVTLGGMAAPIADRLIRGRSAEVAGLAGSLAYLAINAQHGPDAALAALR